MSAGQLGCAHMLEPPAWMSVGELGCAHVHIHAGQATSKLEPQLGCPLASMDAHVRIQAGQATSKQEP